MTESTGVMYIARSKNKIEKEELQFHLQHNFTTIEEQIRELAARGYRIIGYTNAVGMFDLNDRLVADGVQEGDLAMLGHVASSLMPREVWKYANVKPLPTAREVAEQAAGELVLAS